MCACSSGGGTPADAGSDAGGFGFAPSNLGDLLSTLDLSKLGDIDATGQDLVDVDCGATAPGFCLQADVTQSDGSTLHVYVARSWKVEQTAKLTVTAKTPIAIVATNDIDILGKLDASSQDFGGIGGGYSGTVQSKGAGPGGGGIGSEVDDTPGVGGGGGAFCGAGGKGGDTSGAMGVGGTPYGSPTLVPLSGGSAGGGAELFGGAGGGAIQLVAAHAITISGVVAAGGGGGSNGGPYSAGQASSGGGSGGALLLEAPSVTVSGTLAVNGGGGGSTGAKGADATPDATPAAGGEPTSDGAGGDGSAAATTAGADGKTGDTTGTGTRDVAGGGGGGAGYIRINTTSGAASITGVLSPALGPCATQGTLH